MTNYSRRSTDTMIRTDAMLRDGSAFRGAMWAFILESIGAAAATLGFGLILLTYWLYKHGVIQ